MSESYHGSQQHQEDVKQLHSMGYAQELSRRMSGFSNFAISFSIICIIAGGITSFQAGFSAAGGASIGIGWPLACGFSLIVAASMGQIASAYPTAGGLYHWASILGGRGFGWSVAWFNMLGLIFVVSSVDVGLWQILFVPLIGQNYLGWDPANFIPDLSKSFSEQIATGAFWVQALAMVIILGSQSLLNHIGIRATTLLTDFSGYLIIVVAVILTIAMLAYAPGIDIGRLFTFTNNTGDPGNGIWPRSENLFYAFLLGLLLPAYTVTGFDASAHTSEETRSAAVNVPKGMIRSVFWSFLFGYVMICSFVLAMPNVTDGAKQGANVFFWLMNAVPMPDFLKTLLYIGIVVANYLCALAGLTSLSRMIFAFARDGGFPASSWLRHVSAAHRTPVNAIWVGAFLAFLTTLYTPQFWTLAAGCAIFLYLSYAAPIGAGLFAEGKSWTKKGPFQLGAFSKIFAIISCLGALLLFYCGVQPPYDALVWYTIYLLVIMAVVWFGLARTRFPGPPIGDMIAKRQAELAAAEKAVGEAAH
ncbi:MAG TPA: amino acid permease [Methylomirabilota bacterium]|nr:amino acid permease [Methylomirabilota bacterium]